MRIAILVEGQTEKVFLPALRRYLQARLAGKMPNLDPVPYRGRIPKKDQLKKEVRKLLDAPRTGADAVIALSDVYTGSRPPEFADAADAKQKMREWVGPETRFHPHAAQFEFEAWLLPYWSRLQSMAGTALPPPGGDPETVNQDTPPSKRIKELFRRGSKGRTFLKRRDADRLLRHADLSLAVSQCAELRALVNTILKLCGESPVSA